MFVICIMVKNGPRCIETLIQKSTKYMEDLSLENEPEKFYSILYLILIFMIINKKYQLPNYKKYRMYIL